MQRRPRKSRIGRRSTSEAMATTGARDTSTYDICEPWYGDKGGPFTRTFSPAFLSGMRGKSEEYVTYYDHLQGDSPGATRLCLWGLPRVPCRSTWRTEAA